MRHTHLLPAVFLLPILPTGSPLAANTNCPKESTVALLSTESAPEGGRCWTPILDQFIKDLASPVKQVASTDDRGSIEAPKFIKVHIRQLGLKGYTRRPAISSPWRSS